MSMKQEKKMVREDINFLEYPNWIINKRSKTKEWVVERQNGKYKIAGSEGLPSHFDKTVLYYLLYKLYRETGLEKTTVTTTRYEIAKNALPDIRNVGKNQYDRIMKSLKIWHSLSIHFDGVFYEGDGHTIRLFHVIDDVKLQTKTGELTVRFNESYLKQLKETTFYIFIDFEQYKKLQKASSARLYEILIKTFKDRAEWAINIQTLADKLTFEIREGAKTHYPSDVLRQLKSAINEINGKTDLTIRLDYNRGTNTCIFQRMETPKKNEYIPATSDKKLASDKIKQNKELLQTFSDLPIAEQERILKKVKADPFAQYLKTDEERALAFMKRNKTGVISAK